METCIAISANFVACVLSGVWLVAIGGLLLGARTYTRLGMGESYSPIGIFMWLAVALLVTWMALQADPNGATNCTKIITVP